MHSTLALSVVPFLLSLTHATNIPITVGADAELAFNPQVITASVGDTLTFSYFPKNHSVVQSSFTDPCHPLADGFFSGFQPLAAGPGPVEFVVTVNDTKPIWIYCSQTSHCQKGMAMVVNQPAPPSPNTLDAYKLAAAKTGISSSPPNIEGGVFISLNSTSTTGSTSTGSASSSGVGSSSSSGSGGSSTGSGSGSGSQSSPISFPGGAAKTAAGFIMLTLAAGGACLALF
ncbi:hypothetical protein ABVK25_005149 [Lepraria finkii]|uniref:Cupredoxin n=1 Tax=Lepraria finkii TaxID=1340010 RepID=A0ABR4B969_9LECA